GMTSGIARGIHAYADLDGNPVLVAASESAVNAWMGGTRVDITPNWKDIWLDPTANRGFSGGVMTIRWNVYQPSTGVSAVAPHDLVVGDMVTISGVPFTAGQVQLNGTFKIKEVVDAYQFKIDVGSGTSPGISGPFTLTVAFRVGLANGTGDTPATRPRAWSISNFGENAVMCASDGSPVFTWQPALSTPNVITNSTFEVLAPWTGMTVSGGTVGAGVGPGAGGLNATLGYDVSGGGLEGGKVYEMAFQIISASSLTVFRVQIDAIDIFPRFVGPTGVF